MFPQHVGLLNNGKYEEMILMCSIYSHHYRALRACETLKGDAALGNRSSGDPKARDKFDGTCVLVGERVRAGMTSSDERVATLKLH